MCIIVVKPAGASFPNETRIAACFENNPDGAGLMWREPDGRIHILKGFMRPAHLEKWIRKNSHRVIDTDVVLHFRLATHGGVAQGNCHPFPITRNVDMLRKLECVTERAMAHNGILTAYGNKSKTLSDTMVFVKYLSGLSDTFIAHEIGQTFGKFAYMSKTDTIMFGTFIDGKDGCFYSNDGYFVWTRSYTGRRYADDWRGSGFKGDDLYDDDCPFHYQCLTCTEEVCRISSVYTKQDKSKGGALTLLPSAALNYDLDKQQTKLEEEKAAEIEDISRLSIP